MRGDPPGASVESSRWEHFHHEADVGVRGIAPDVAGAFAQAALALVAVVCPPERVRPRQVVELRVEPPQGEKPDLELLLYEFLNEVVFQMSARRMLFGRFEVQVQGGALRGRAWGEPVDPGRHQPAVEVKGATMTALRVAQRGDAWLAQAVVDV